MRFPFTETKSTPVGAPKLFAKYKIVHEGVYSWAVYVKEPGTCGWKPAETVPSWAYRRPYWTHVWSSEEEAISQMKNFDADLKRAYECEVAARNHVVTEKIYE